MKHYTVSGFFRFLILTKLPHRLTIPAKMAEMSILIFVSFVFLCLPILHSTAEMQDSVSFPKIVNSDANGVTIELGLSDLNIENKELEGINYHLISYDNCSFTSESGKPKLPITNVFLGIPPYANISVNIIGSKYDDINGYLPLPVPEQSLQRASNGIESLVDRFVIDKNFYRQNVFYPAQVSNIVYEGNIRHQRVIILQISPVQFNPALKLLRKYSKLSIRVNFSSSRLSPAKSYSDDKEFEDSYKSLLLNYESARNWRTAPLQKAPLKLQTQSPSQAIKLFISNRGIYKIDYAMLVGSGIDPKIIDPRTIKIHFLNSQVPIHVHGEADGKFDKGDYIEFFGDKPKSLYTRWNVYWLTWGDKRGVRMVQKNGIPVASSAKEVTFFKSKTRFEEDHLHHKLQNVSQDPNDPEAWFESRDHWFWTGVENASPKNEVTVKFPIYDLAQSLSKPDFKIELVGCTNFNHEVMISVNGFRAGEEAKWDSQDIYTFDGQIPTDSIIDGFENELRLTRIGSNPSDGVDMDSYPYQIYLNWFEIGYFRKLLAVNDVLEFSTPEQKESKPLAIIGIENRITLDKGKIPPELTQRLKSAKVTLSQNAVLTTLESGSKWMLVDNQQVYLIVKELDSLNIYANDINDYTVSGFLNKDIEVFQISNSNAICKIKDIIIKEYKMTQEERLRLRRILENNNDGVFSNLAVPETAYSATFEDDGSQHFEYIAVSSASILKPDKIELDMPSDLKNTSNRADYIIITHPMFINSAKKLAEWRSGKLGGSFTSKVIDVTDIYDEFGSGMASPHAIKDFLRYAYNNWSKPTPSYVLIFGDGTYDFLGNDKKTYKEAPELIGFIPSFYIKTTFGQTAVDHWYSTIDGDDGFPDIYLGRIPVESNEEAESVIHKIIANESLKKNGNWRKQIISIADDETHAAGDEIFQIGLEDLWLNHTPIGYDTTKIYLKEIIKQVQQNTNENRIPSDVAQEMIMDSFANGAVIAQYSGHGGRHVWAHEIIFSITDIEDLKETEIYPFLFVFSCYNGYFDVPGELSMAEGMLRANKKGVVAMLSATRLTYGHGNVVLNNLMFDGIFNDKLLRIGQVTTISKTKLLKQEGLVWLTQMYEYTLFGDPASRLNISDYELNPKPAKSSVSSGGKIEVGSSQVMNLNKQSSNVSGSAIASIILPDGRKENKNISINNGIMSAVSFDIPQNAPNGEGYFKVFGELGNESVVGGFRFNIGNPFIVSIKHELNGDRLQIYAQVDDDSGLLKSVVLLWNAGLGEKESVMIFDQVKNAYRIQEPIQISGLSKDITYKIRATDQNNNVITSDQMKINPSSKPNLLVNKMPDGTEIIAKYVYSQQFQKWGLNIELANSSQSSVSCQVQLMIFDSNPDINNDRIVDKEAIAIGNIDVKISDWSPIIDNMQTAKVFVPCELPYGIGTLFVWIDPPTDDNTKGKCEEENENDNISYKMIDVADVVVSPGMKVIFSDSLGEISATIPSESINQQKHLSFAHIENIKIDNNQPSISSIPSPSGKKIGFRLYDPSLTNNITFESPITLNIVYEINPIRESIKREIGLGDVPDSSLDTDQKDIIERKLKDRISSMGIYLWHESANRWSRLPSRSILGEGGSLLRSVHAIRVNGTGMINMLNTDKNINTSIDEWFINFVGSKSFVVRGAKTGIIKKGGQDYIGNIGEIFYDPNTGIRLQITNGITPFKSGDTLRFKTIEVGTIEADSQWSGVFGLMINADNRPPNIKIDIANQQFANGDVVSSEPNIHAIISDDNGVDILSRKIDILTSFDGGDFVPADTESYILKSDPKSNSVTINYKPNKLESGSYEVKIQAYDFNGNLGIRSIIFDVKGELKLEDKSLMNYPNPFEKETDITFHISSVADKATIKIYTVSGRLIRKLETDNAINFVVMHWDGRDEGGKEVANGVYYYKLNLKSNGNKDITKIGKMLKLK